MNCLQDFIGINYCGAPVPDSGVYINDLPGINLIGLDKIADAEQKTFAAVWEAIQKRSLLRFSSAVNNEFGRRYRLKRLNQSIVLPEIVNTTTNQTAAANEKRGFTLKIGGEQWVSALQSIHIQSLRLYQKTAVNTTIKFYDVTGAILNEVKSISVTGAVGWQTVNVNTTFHGVSKLFVGYDATGISSPETKIDSSLDACDCDACECYPCGIKVQPAKYNGTDITTGNNTFGLSGIVSSVCDFNNIACTNKAMFTTALWYLQGAEAMAERIYTDRINRYTTVDLNKARDLREEWELQFRQELMAAINGIDLSLNDCCIECNHQVTSVEMRP